MRPNESFTRLTDKRIIEQLEEIAQQRKLPIELITFSTNSAAKILGTSERSLRDLIAQRKIRFVQYKQRGKIIFTAKDLIEFLNENKCEII